MLIPVLEQPLWLLFCFRIFQEREIIGFISFTGGSVTVSKWVIESHQETVADWINNGGSDRPNCLTFHIVMVNIEQTSGNPDIIHL